MFEGQEIALECLDTHCAFQWSSTITIHENDTSETLRKRACNMFSKLRGVDSDQIRVSTEMFTGTKSMYLELLEKLPKTDTLYLQIPGLSNTLLFCLCFFFVLSLFSLLSCLRSHCFPLLDTWKRLAADSDQITEDVRHMFACPSFAVSRLPHSQQPSAKRRKEISAVINTPPDLIAFLNHALPNSTINPNRHTANTRTVCS